MGSPLTELMCTNCGAIVRQIDKKLFRCTGCETLFVLDQDARGDDFLYQKIEVEKIEGGKISAISTELPTKHIVVREVKLADDFEDKVSKDSHLSKKESVDAVRAFITNNDYVKALEVINENLSSDSSIGELYFYRILARKQIPQIEKIFGLSFTVEDRNDLETCFENSSPQFISAQIKKLFSNVVVDDQSTRLLLESSIPYSMSEQVLGLEETSRLLEKPFDLVIDKSYRSSFEYLLRSLNNSDVKKYIDYNIRFAKKCPDPAVAKKAIQNVLKVDSGNPEALFSLVTIDLSFEGLSLEETTKDFKQFIEYSSNSDKDIIKVLDYVKSIRPDKLTHKISEFIKKAVGYYSLGFEKLNNYLLDFAYAFLKAGYLQKQGVLFKDAENFLHLCLSIDKNDSRIYWGLCLFAVQAYDDTSAVNSDEKLLKDTAVFTKYIAITSDKPEQKHAFDVSNKQEQRIALDSKRAKAKRRRKKIIIAAGSGIAVVIIAIVAAIASVSVAKKRDRAASNFVISVTSKENDYKDSMYYDGYVVGFHISLNNKSSLNISELLGDMRITLNSPSYSWEYNTSLYDYNGGIKAKGVSNFVLTIDERESEKTLALYNSSIDKLQIEYKLTKITFNTYETQTYSESYHVIKPYGSYGGDTSGEEQDRINEEKYQQAVSLFNQGKYEEALTIFETISFYKNSSTYITNCRNAINEQKYQHALSLMNSGNYDEAIAEFESIVDYKDSQTQIYECKYRKARALYNSNNLIDSYNLFLEISSYKDSSTYITTIQNDADTVAQGYALAGNYQQAIDLLKAVGKTKTTSDLYAACSDATSGNYRSFVALLNPSKVIVASNLKNLPSQAFYNCENVTEIVLPNSLTKIGSYAFSGCSSLIKINMPDSITTIEEKAFMSCTSLASISIPSCLESLGGNILTWCSSLSTITTKLSNKYSIASFFKSIPSSVSDTPSWPSALSKIVITSGNTIPEGFFSYLPSTVTNIQFAENIVEVGENAFAGADIGLILPTTVKTIGSYAYSNLGYLGDEITLHEGLEKIGTWAFQDTTFKTINLPGSLTSIGRAVFGGSGTDNNTLKKINFNGTKEKWLTIVNSQWSYGMNHYYDVECTDAIYHHSMHDSETGWTDK